MGNTIRTYGINWHLPNNKCPICKMHVNEIGINRSVIDILNSDTNTTNLLILQRMNQLNSNVQQINRRLDNNDCCTIN